jgi:lipopolysaccharide transport system permease protein
MVLRSVADRRAFTARVARTANLLRTLVPREFRIRYRESYLDLAWAIITPLVILAVYGVILTQAFDADGGCAPYLSSAWVGLVLWTFFASGLSSATNSMLDSSELMTKIYFPREALPLASVGVTLIDLALGAVTIVVLALAQGVHLSVTALAAIPAVLLLIIWTAALSVLAAALTVFVRDVIHAVNLFLRAGFFATPVMYSADFFPDWLQWMVTVNPIAVAITTTRNGLLCGQWPDWKLVGVQLLAGSLLFVGSVLFVRRTEASMVDVL